MPNPTLIGDPQVRLVPLQDDGDPLVELTWIDGPASTAARHVRAGLADRLLAAQRTLPDGLRLSLSEGYRPVRSQAEIIARYTSSLRARRPDLAPWEIVELSTRYVAPLDVAPHVAGAAVDLTLVDARGREVDMGCPLDATPEESGGTCYFAAPGIAPQARAYRDLLARALTQAGLVNYPTEWWHWSYGDRYWALVTGAPHALYGPVERSAAAA
ncbi:M15 family metallopeptidase [Oerskovia sp. NPDC056781]|uniref:M15 family metallopeptidase n=1 Tax=Oerskovia sp. NPDC056781 TaxID=3345942 RepID=UPI00366F88E4